MTKLERALEDVLEKFSMPALDLYVSPAIKDQQHQGQLTRSNSEEPQRNERDVSPDPINSLIEATQLGGLRSQLRSAKQRRKGGMLRTDHDLVSERVITLQEAKKMLGTTQSHHLLSAAIAPDATLEAIRASSTVFFTALMLVIILHVPGKEALHEMCHSLFSGLVAQVMFDRFHTLDDIRGLCIAAFGEPHLSWKLSGLSIRMATELNLHHAFYEAFNEPDMSSEARKGHLEEARL
ncbi:hypothetical protein LTR70_010221 [Exophiala xenobiotica]|uniref:Uncharacterized protein n=1 Tax=Lithohypha guttulata TaxID=1690604 RepID=A0ABR0JVI2_9EURO|nr:hypothetical protein LTR24_010048 [Lithohypha guttulata]KAK5309526.1 hypothetical protein LTR70_010221 [Exophiala xenobiotica]